MVLFDAGILIKLLDARTPDTQREKLDYLLTTLQKSKTKILIPTPALSEFYVKADPDVIANFKGKSAFVIASFDEKAALECSISVADAIRSGDKKAAQPDAPWQKIKFDHQIVAIAKSHRATTIYSEDSGLRRFAELLGLKAFCTNDLPENPGSKQQKLDLGGSSASEP
ncbi:type II toxin-antitoxin system VapC family toxin [Oxalobacteraceae bacterium OTU3REALA1]|nr:type II toxin-antitoxin system VapC family toxin [Oxalobacteraceae bacterium OTU3REALA1]